MKAFILLLSFYYFIHSVECTAKFSAESVLSSLQSGYQQLISYYDYKTGFFGDSSSGTPLWTTANQLETLANYYALSSDSSVLAYFENSYVQLKHSYCNCYRDDMLWFVNTWARIYSVTRNQTYLDQSIDIFDDLVRSKFD